VLRALWPSGENRQEGDATGDPGPYGYRLLRFDPANGALASYAFPLQVTEQVAPSALATDGRATTWNQTQAGALQGPGWNQ
jgi:hypothetical protein